MDNSGYTSNFKTDSTLAVRALNEMVRIVRPGGQILVTVPFGKYEDHGWLLNYDSQHWQTLLDTVRDRATIKEFYFRHTASNGWESAEAKDLAETGYYGQSNHGAAAIATALINKSRVACGTLV